MPEISVKAAAGVVKFMPGGSTEIKKEIETGMTVGELLDMLGVPRTGPSIILVNKTAAGFETKLGDGDTIHLLPMVVGG